MRHVEIGHFDENGLYGLDFGSNRFTNIHACTGTRIYGNAVKRLFRHERHGGVTIVLYAQQKIVVCFLEIYFFGDKRLRKVVIPTVLFGFGAQDNGLGHYVRLVIDIVYAVDCKFFRDPACIQSNVLHLQIQQVFVKAFCACLVHIPSRKRIPHSFRRGQFRNFVGAVCQIGKGRIKPCRTERNRVLFVAEVVLNDFNRRLAFVA